MPAAPAARFDGQRILISGASGLVGSALEAQLRAAGAQTSSLTRGAADAARGRIHWDPAKRELDAAQLEGFDAVVHLAGENIGGGRWTRVQKERLLESRSQGTRLIAGALAAAKKKPRALVCASAIGYYGDRGEELLTEASAAGQGFLPDVCRAWEHASHAARNSGIRVVTLRYGIVLSARGGALAKMLTPFRLGLGGPLGSGRQWMSWIALEDAVGAIQVALANGNWNGAFNAVAPQPVRNADFTRALARVLKRPAILPAPAFALRLALGEMADALLLASTRVVPERLQQAGYVHRHPELEGALRAALAQRAD